MKLQTARVETTTTWDKLARILPARPIRTAKRHNLACEIAGRLAALNRPSRDQADYFQALSIFIEEYERVHYPVDDSSITPLDTLRYLMREHGMTASDLGYLLNNRSLGTRILKGERDLSKSHIQKLSLYFGVSPAVFIDLNSPKLKSRQFWGRSVRLERMGKTGSVRPLISRTSGRRHGAGLKNAAP